MSYQDEYAILLGLILIGILLPMAIGLFVAYYDGR